MAKTPEEWQLEEDEAFYASLAQAEQDRLDEEYERSTWYDDDEY